MQMIVTVNVRSSLTDIGAYSKVTWTVIGTGPCEYDVLAAYMCQFPFAWVLMRSDTSSPVSDRVKVNSNAPQKLGSLFAVLTVSVKTPGLMT